jgi:phosphoglycolate phosphatase
MKLVLFDIDGTILLTDGAGKRAIHRALREVFGSTGPDDHHFGGKTDPQIVRELMRIEGHEDLISTIACPCCSTGMSDTSARNC